VADVKVGLLVISPHLDDAVLSCGRLLAAHPGAVVVTVFAGRPGDDRLVEWDRMSGFGPADDPIGIRRREDRWALRLLRARPVWLDLPQDVYRDPDPDGLPEPDALAAQVRAQVRAVIDVLDPARIALPLGLHHPDHHAVADALRGALPGRSVVLYADQPYALDQPRLLADRLDALGPLRPVAGGRWGRWRKTVALLAYRSQLRAMGRNVARRSGAAPESFWSLESPASPASPGSPG
jgi:LmbE family N-acetylglucosaminyl deacetylase